jgi:nitroreductase
MGFTSLAKATGTVHSFAKGVGPSEAELAMCLETCLWAPNHKKTFPWKIIKASEKSRKIIAETAALLKSKAGLSKADSDLAYEKSLAPKDLLVFVHDRLPEDSFRERENYASLCCSIQLLALALREIGFGYKWSTGKLSRSSEVSSLFNLTEKQEVIGFVWIGKEAATVSRPDRPDLERFFSIQ